MLPFTMLYGILYIQLGKAQMPVPQPNTNTMKTKTIFTNQEFEVIQFWKYSLGIMQELDPELRVLNRAAEDGSYTIPSILKWLRLSDRLGLSVEETKKIAHSAIAKARNYPKLWLALCA